MASERRVGSESSETRKRLLDVAERLMLDEGYAAVTTRRVAGVAGVNPALVHYYFPVTDDLFLAVYRQGAERAMDRHRAATEAPQPLRAMWSLSMDARGTGLVMEFAALANHRKAVRSEIAEYGRRHRELQTEAVSRIFADYGVGPGEMTPSQMVLQMTALSRMLIVEESVGLTTGHKDAMALIENLLDRYEPLPRTARARRAPRRS
ncbi:MAG: TetR/AcrR family transcriptional regulator [Actinobacteria bacterium]|nr:TetR/AcrR family transcriptional regulator [Actinomycetota bacterium]